MKYLLDTHVWAWWNMHPENLSGKVKRLITASEKYEEILLSAISVWELCKLLEKGRIRISCDPRDWLEAALAMPKLRLVPLTPAIVYRSTTLLQLASTDPADQIIVATAQEENAVLLTKDALIRKSKHVRAIW
ncbi:MAG: type II toxin-antitoxin system VapC family toxin [Pirellulales bacterium]|nr:type II toxin-antitoxin system VapC family toxin [Pirellulales bacterium]